jgi:hypothetical protein
MGAGVSVSARTGADAGNSNAASELTPLDIGITLDGTAVPVPDFLG